jgi:hypothetical protein
MRFPALSATTQKDLAAAYDLADDGAREEVRAVFHGVHRDVQQLSTRLQAANVDLYDRYDRLLSEATLRINIIPPICVLVMAAAWDSEMDLIWSVVSTLLLASSILILLRQMAARVAQANEVIAQALIAGIIASALSKTSGPSVVGDGGRPAGSSEPLPAESSTLPSI